MTQQSALDSAGPASAAIESLWWVTLFVLIAVFVLVTVFLIRGLRRNPGRNLPYLYSDREHSYLRRSVGFAVGVTVVILFAFLLSDLFTGRAIAGLASDQDTPPITIEVIGHQWWWELRYRDSLASNNFTTANELHIPVGRPIRLYLTSHDVIHSFWVPNLHGKRDLTPGYIAQSWIQADRPGIYGGLCAEFCGHQHAKMRLTVIAESLDDYTKWVENEKSPSLPPADSIQQRGLSTFTNGSCILCHTIAGTEANGKMGPDLTHIGSRLTLAAGSLPHTSGNLAAWIVDPQRIKPGTKMPPNPIQPADLQALIAYLENLQ
jgi:cytochrome c oxidase subunit II